MKNKKLTTYQMSVTALMAAAMCVLGPLTVPIGAIPISLANFVICLTAWLLGPKFGTLSVAVYLLIGLVGVPVFSGYGAGIAKLAGPTGGYLLCGGPRCPPAGGGPCAAPRRLRRDRRRQRRRSGLYPAADVSGARQR